MYADELMGFVIVRKSRTRYVDPKRQIPNLSVQKKGLILNVASCRALGMPDYVLVFLDENRRRIMVRAAEKDQENAYLLSYDGTKFRRKVCSWCLSAQLRKLFGQETFTLKGHAPKGTEGILIFEEEPA